MGIPLPGPQVRKSVFSRFMDKPRYLGISQRDTLESFYIPNEEYKDGQTRNTL